MQSRFRFRSLRAWARRAPRWAVWSLALAGGIAIGVIVSTLLELVEPPPVEMALRLPSELQPRAGVAPSAAPAPAPITPSSPPTAAYEPPGPEMTEPPAATGEEPSPMAEEEHAPAMTRDQTINPPSVPPTPMSESAPPPQIAEPAPPPESSPPEPPSIAEDRPESPPQIAEPASPPESSSRAESAALPSEPTPPATEERSEIPPQIAEPASPPESSPPAESAALPPEPPPATEERSEIPPQIAEPALPPESSPPAESAALPPEPTPPSAEEPPAPPQENAVLREVSPPSAAQSPAPPPEVAALPPEPRTPAARQPAIPPSVAPSEIRPEAELPAWRRYAVAVPDVDGRALIAIVIDDMGVDQRHSAQVIDLPGPLTLSFLPYAHDLARQTAAAHRHGHELMVHVPMQPLDARNDPGPNALKPGLPPDEIERRLDLALSAFTGYVGINNHMGSRFTRDRAGMDVVMAELAARSLLFLDSRTVSYSLGASTAAAHGVPHAGRHVFLDNELTMTEVCRQLAETERIAREAGLAIAIGHPHAVTIAALKAWLPTLADKGFALVPVSMVVERLRERRGVAQRAAPAGH